MKTLDSDSFASDPGEITLSAAKLRRFHPTAFGLPGLLKSVVRSFQFRNIVHIRTELREHLKYGDSRAAVVVSLSPLVVAAYTDELDCVAMLRFPDELVNEYQLVRHSRLLTVNAYNYLEPRQADLSEGPASYGRYGFFHPLIAEFLSEDMARINERKLEIAEDEWQRTIDCANEYIAKYKHVARDGRPYCSWIPAF